LLSPMANLMPALVMITIILLLIDILIRALRRRRPHVPQHTNPAASTNHQRMTSLIHDVAAKLERVHDDFNELDHQLTLRDIQEEEAEIARMIDSMHETFVRPKARLAICGPSSSRKRRRRRFSSLCDGYKTDALDTTRMSGAFTSFCERLLATNRIWKQEKQLKRLQSEVQSVEASKRTNAFNAFCTQLVLHNKVWKLEKQVVDLEVEREKLRKRFEATIRRSAMKMIEELQHHRLVEGYVKDMTAEVDSYKLALETRNALHERELQDFTWDWCQEYHKLACELDKLKLAQQANSVQQALYTEHENSLYESLEAAQGKVNELEARLEGYRHTLVETPFDANDDDDATEVDEEDSVSVSSLTCVSLSYDGREAGGSGRKGFSRLSGLPLTPRKVRSARWIRNTKPRDMPRPKQLALGKHTGFSFNPLFYGPNASPLVFRARGARNQVESKGTGGRWKI